MPGARRDERRQLRTGASKQAGGAAASAAGQRDGDGDGGTGGFYGAVTAAAADPGKWFEGMTRWLETSEDTDPVRFVTCCCEEFKPRKIKAPLVLGWLLMQAMGLLYQVALLGEVSTHLEGYETTLSAYCGPEHRQHGVCLGPAWNLSYSGMLSFPASAGEDFQSDFDFVIPADQPFSFQTQSKPPTFLVGVEPQAPHPGARWKVQIAPATGAGFGFPSNPSGTLQPMYGSGSRYNVVTSRFFQGSSWSGTITMESRYMDPAQIHLYVVDSRIQHLEEIHSQEQCSFEESWQNFNERQSGTHHRVLTFAWNATAFFLLVGLLFTGLVLHRFLYRVESGKLLSRIICLKFFVQDIPQQLCIVAYLYGWYASNGLRCQMCLFHPQHCDAEHPLHWSNLMVCVFTLLSSTANQLLLQARVKRVYDEEEECFQWLVRCSLLSVSILPFSTSLFALSASLLHLRSPLIYFLAGVPTLLGWGTVLCVPVFTLFDEDEY